MIHGNITDKKIYQHPDMMHREEQNIISVVFLPKIYNLDLVRRKISGKLKLTDAVQNNQLGLLKSDRERSWKLRNFQSWRKLRKHNKYMNMESWTGFGPQKGHQWGRWQMSKSVDSSHCSYVWCWHWGKLCERYRHRNYYFATFLCLKLILK